jgi:hypothetical protein
MGAIRGGAGAVGGGYATAIVSGILIGTGMTGLGFAMLEGVTDAANGYGLNYCAVDDGINSIMALYAGVTTGVQGYRYIVRRQTHEILQTNSGRIGNRGNCANSFSADMEVSTADGDVLIAEIEVGDKVLAYNEETGEIGEYEVTDTISHVDEDIIHLTIDGELIETTAEHPFYTDDREWVNAADLSVGELVLSLDGDYGTVEAVVVVEDVNQPMYNLTVNEAHTFFIGDGDWLVHNCKVKVSELDPLHSPETSGDRPELMALTDAELLEAVSNPINGDPIKINTITGKVIDGNGRAYELIRRAADPNSTITPDTEIPYIPYTPDNSMFWDLD